MGIFSSILSKLIHHGAQPGAQTAGTQQTQPSSQPTLTGSPPQQSLQNVDVDKVLSDLAATKGGGGNYRESIVDLLKLLDLDSSLNARKELAEELAVHAGAHGSAEQNIALHKAVMRKLAENGGKVPESLKN